MRINQELEDELTATKSLNFVPLDVKELAPEAAESPLK